MKKEEIRDILLAYWKPSSKRPSSLSWLMVAPFKDEKELIEESRERKVSLKISWIDEGEEDYISVEEMAEIFVKIAENNEAIRQTRERLEGLDFCSSQVYRSFLSSVIPDEVQKQGGSFVQAWKEYVNRYIAPSSSVCSEELPDEESGVDPLVALSKKQMETVALEGVIRQQDWIIDGDYEQYDLEGRVEEKRKNHLRNIFYQFNQAIERKNWSDVHAAADSLYLLVEEKSVLNGEIWNESAREQRKELKKIENRIPYLHRSRRIEDKVFNPDLKKELEALQKRFRIIIEENKRKKRRES